MTKDNLVTVRPGVDLETAKELLHRHRIEKLLVVDDHFELKGLITVKDIRRQFNIPTPAKTNAAGCASARRWASAIGNRGWKGWCARGSI